MCLVPGQASLQTEARSAEGCACTCPRWLTGRCSQVCRPPVRQTLQDENLSVFFSLFLTTSMLSGLSCGDQTGKDLTVGSRASHRQPSRSWNVVIVLAPPGQVEDFPIPILHPSGWQGDFFTLLEREVRQSSPFFQCRMLKAQGMRLAPGPTPSQRHSLAQCSRDRSLQHGGLVLLSSSFPQGIVCTLVAWLPT